MWRDVTGASGMGRGLRKGSGGTWWTRAALPAATGVDMDVPALLLVWHVRGSPPVSLCRQAGKAGTGLGIGVGVRGQGGRENCCRADFGGPEKEPRKRPG